MFTALPVFFDIHYVERTGRRAKCWRETDEHTVGKRLKLGVDGKPVERGGSADEQHVTKFLAKLSVLFYEIRKRLRRVELGAAITYSTEWTVGSLFRGELGAALHQV